MAQWQISLIGNHSPKLDCIFWLGTWAPSPDSQVAQHNPATQTTKMPQLPNHHYLHQPSSSKCSGKYHSSPCCPRPRQLNAANRKTKTRAAAPRIVAQHILPTYPHNIRISFRHTRPMKFQHFLGQTNSGSRSALLAVNQGLSTNGC